MIDKVLDERGKTHGNFKMNSIVSQGIKNHLKLGVNWDALDVEQKEALEMISNKLARIVNGEPRYRDSWTDVIGYASLVERRLRDDENRKSFPKEG